MPSRRDGRSRICRAVMLSSLTLGLLAACGGQPKRPGPPPASVSAPSSAPAVPSAPGAAGGLVSPVEAAGYRRGLAAMQRRDWPSAEREFLTLMAGSPQLPGPAVNLGIVYREAGRTAEAERTLREAAQKWPQFAPAHHQLGLLLRSQGKFTDADAEYEAALSADPNYAAAHYNRAVLNDLYLQRPEVALQHYETYLQLQGKDEQVARWVADLRRRAGLEPPPSAAPASEPEALPTEDPAVTPAPDSSGMESPGTPIPGATGVTP